MDFTFFRQHDLDYVEDELPGLTGNLIEDTTQIVTNWQDAVVTNIPMPPSDPVRKAAYVQIGLVSVDTNTQLPALLRDVTPSNLIQHVHLPRNPRIADNELYQLDGMDYIVMLIGHDNRINKDVVRWLKFLKRLQVPMVVLLPYEVKKRREQKQVDLFAQRVGVPFISVTGDDVSTARETFITTTMQQMPAMSLALAANSPAFRQPLMDNLLETATSDSLLLDNADSVQMQLVRQMCAAHGYTERDFEKHQISMDTMIASTKQVAQNLVRLFPIKNDIRCARLTQAVATLLIGHATTMYLGGSSPSLRKVLIPQIWRLYRASRKSVSG